MGSEMCIRDRDKTVLGFVNGVFSLVLLPQQSSVELGRVKHQVLLA